MPNVCAEQKTSMVLHTDHPAGPSPASAYLRGVSSDDRRALGMVYTPPHLVSFILDCAGYVPSSEIEDAPLLDPSCGGGAFLAAAVERLAARIAALGGTVATRAGHARLERWVEHSVFGVDVDPTACALAREALAASVARVTGRAVSPRRFDANVVLGDFLADSWVHDAPPAARRDLAFVVGNPPYVSATRIDAGEKSALRERFRAASGRVDLYALFMERSLELLKAGGRLSFITPDKYLASQSARSLRSLILTAGAVRTLATFNSHKVFEDAATVPCVTVVERGAATGNVVVLACGDRPGADGNVPIARRDVLPRERLSPGGWQVHADEWRALAARLTRGCAPLATHTSRISAGLATGRDAVFVVPEGSADVEPELLRPAVRGRDLRAFGVAAPSLEVLVPYRFDAAKAALVDLRDFPRAARHLAAFREELEARHCVRTWGKRWYDVHDPVSCDLATRPKILVPDVAESNRFAFDEGKRWPLHSAYYLIPAGIDPWFLTAVLNSAVAEFLIRLSAPVVKDGFSRYRRQFLLDLPVPPADAPEVARVARAAADGDIADASARVARLFRLSAADDRAIRTFLASRRPPSAREAA